MVKVIRIRTAGDIKKVDGLLAGIRKRLPEMTSKAMRRWGKTLEADLKMAAIQAGISKFTGTLQTTGIEYRQRPRGRTGYLFIRQYGVMLDSMRPHWVNIRASRTRFVLWAQQARSSIIRNAGVLIASGRLRKKAIYVRPHPFIQSGWRRARPKLRAIIKQTIDSEKIVR